MMGCDEPERGFPEVRPFKVIPLGWGERETEGVVMYHYIKADERMGGAARRPGHEPRHELCSSWSHISILKDCIREQRCWLLLQTDVNTIDN